MVSKSLRSLTKNERMSESLVFLSESLIRSFLGKKRAIRSENRWAKSQPCFQIFWSEVPFKKVHFIYFGALAYEGYVQSQYSCPDTVDGYQGPVKT